MKIILKNEKGERLFPVYKWYQDKRRKFSPAIKNKIVDFYNQGFSICEIVEMIKMSRSQVRRYLMEPNYLKRQRSKWNKQKRILMKSDKNLYDRFKILAGKYWKRKRKICPLNKYYHDLYCYNKPYFQDYYWHYYRNRR